MWRLRQIARMLERWFHRQHVEEELHEEVQAYFDIQVERGMARGLTRDEAQRAARLQLGGAEQVKAHVRDARTGSAVETTLQDIRYSFRMLWRSPGFTLVAVAALALGIGANTAIFSVVNAVLLKSLPYPEPDRLVMFETRSPQGGIPLGSPTKFQHWRQQSTVVQDVAAFLSTVVNYTASNSSEQLRASQVSADYFRLFGASVERGRTFSVAEDRPGGHHVVVLSHGLWTRRFGSDPNIVGRTIPLNGEAYEVIGIIGPNFDMANFGPPPELWMPFQLDPNTRETGHDFQVAGRLKQGVTLVQAQARLQLSGAAYRENFPGALPANTRFNVQPLRKALVGNASPMLVVLAGAVTFVLLIACANVANLLLARATGRRRELAVRAAIGAGRGRLIRQSLAESLVLSMMGGAIGLVVGLIGIRLLLGSDTAGLPRVGEGGSGIALDWRVLTFTMLVSLGTGVLFGVVPALHASRADLTSVLKASSGRSGTGFRENKTRAVFVVTEVALALVLLVGAALLMRTVIALSTVDPGFNATNVLTMGMSVTGPRFVKSENVERVVRAGVERVRTVPGVVEVGATCCVPLKAAFGLPFAVVGRPVEGITSWISTSPGVFGVFKMPVKRGRAFTERDTAEAPPVVMINETMAREYWSEGDPLRDRLVIGGSGPMRDPRERERQIIGIVGDVRDQALNRDPGPQMYIPLGQMPNKVNALFSEIAPMGWVIRTHVAPYSLSASIQDALHQASGLVVFDIRTMEEVVSRSTSRQRIGMWLMTVFGGSALLLAAIGIYGLMAYAVQQRTQEIGIRIALGARISQVKNMVIVQGMRLALVGVVIGIASAFGLTRFMASFLFGVETWDPTVFVMAPLILSAVAFLAAWIPARRASRVDPVIALRAE